MRIGVLGTGRMGAFRARALARHPEVTQVIVGSHHPERAAALAAELGAEAGDGPGGTPTLGPEASSTDTAPTATAARIDEVLEADLDALVICTATAEHPEQIAAGARRGLPMLCEKPISIHLSDTEAAIRVAREAGVQLQIAFQRRFDPGFRTARDLVSSGSLGTLYSMRMCAHDHEPADERYIATSGGIFCDLHVHDFDMARWLTGCEVKEVYATGTVRAWERYGRQDDVDTAAIMLTMDDEMPVVITGARHDPLGYDFRTEILGSEDSVVIGVGYRTPVHPLDPEGPPPTNVPYRGFLDRFASAFAAETDAFIDLLAGRAENPCPPEEALQALKVALACERSWREHRPVALEETAPVG